MVKIEPRTLKGFRDYGPKEQLARQQMFAKIQSVFERFGFLPLSTPVLEYKDILMGKDVIGRPRDIQEIINYRKVIEFIDDEANKKIDKIS